MVDNPDPPFLFHKTREEKLEELRAAVFEACDNSSANGYQEDETCSVSDVLDFDDRVYELTLALFGTPSYPDVLDLVAATEHLEKLFEEWRAL